MEWSVLFIHYAVKLRSLSKTGYELDLLSYNCYDHTVNALQVMTLSQSLHCRCSGSAEDLPS